MSENAQSDIVEKSFEENLQTVFSLANVQDANDALFVALHVLMLNMDFVPKGCSYDKRFESFPHNSRNNGVYSIEYSHFHFPNTTCQMVVVCLGHSMVIHGTLMGQEPNGNRAVSFDVQQHCKSNVSSASCIENVYRDISQLSLTFKDSFVIPLLSDVYEASGVQPAFAFKNLTTDLKHCVLSYLPVGSVIAVSKVNKELNGLANSWLLWKKLYCRDFPDALPECTLCQHNWKDLYRDEYCRQKRERARKMARPISHFIPFGIDHGRPPPLPHPLLIFPERGPSMLLPPEVQDAFPGLRDRYGIENPILRHMMLRNPNVFPYSIYNFM